jgi:rhodanese-related sulfurtransferase
LEYFVDTRINSSRSVSSFLISPQELGSRLGHADAPLLLDVRPQARFEASARMLVGARRCSLEDMPALAAALFAANPHQKVVTYCVYGHHVGADAAAVLRAAGLSAQALAGGFEGGEDGVDNAQDTAQWRMAAPLTMAKRMDWGVPNSQASRWVTRARPKIDRIACPWLIRRFIDPRAEFFYVPTEQVFDEAKRLNAVAYDIPGAPVSHEGARCSFEVLVHAFGLQHAALDKLARMVCGADTDRLDMAPESAGLLALSLGLSRLHADDHTMLEAAMPMYDALYAWCQSVSTAVWQGSPAETHNWPPEAEFKGKV